MRHHFESASLVFIVALALSIGFHLSVGGTLEKLARYQAAVLAALQSAIEESPGDVEIEYDPFVEQAQGLDAGVPRADAGAAEPSETQGRSRPARAATRGRPRPPPRRSEPRRQQVAELELPPPPPPAPPPEPQPEAPAPPPPPPPPEEERTAITQRSQNPDVEPPPDTQYIAEENNRVEEETVAEQENMVRDDDEVQAAAAEPDTATDEAAENEGNADETEVAEADDTEGMEDRYETPEESMRERPRRPRRARTARQASGDQRAGARNGEEAGDSDGSGGGGEDAVAARVGREGGGDERANGGPVIATNENGTLRVGPGGPRGVGPGDAGGEAQARVDGRAGSEGRRGRRTRRGTGRGAGMMGPNLRLSWSQFQDVVGEQQLEDEREAFFAQRRSRTRGRDHGRRWQEFRAALENYTPSVRPGSQTALNAARSPFAAYIGAVHRRLHQTYHDFVDQLPAYSSSPFADLTLRTRLEIVLNRDGSVHRVGVVRSSGISMFDYGAYNAVMRGQPYPQAPTAITSGDGRVYMHWGFHRRQPYCHQSHARPFIIPRPEGSPAEQAGAVEERPGLQQDVVVPAGTRHTWGTDGEPGGANPPGGDEEDADESGGPGEPREGGGGGENDGAPPRAPLRPERTPQRDGGGDDEGSSGGADPPAGGGDDDGAGRGERGGSPDAQPERRAPRTPMRPNPPAGSGGSAAA